MTFLDENEKYGENFLKDSPSNTGNKTLCRRLSRSRVLGNWRTTPQHWMVSSF